ncbi:glucohydrolase, partial [Streptomyces sp. SID8455]|nr:glucohydrolase [Streptomyces sp. SID8455]
HGDFTMLLPDDERIYAFTRRHGSTELLAAGNFTGETVTVDMPDGWEGAELVLGNGPSASAAPGRLVLAPWEARVHRRTV